MRTGIRNLSHGAAAILLVLVTCLGVAYADRVTDLIRQVKTEDNYKVRVSAILTLGRLKDPRSIPTLISALGDENKTVRGVAAAALSKVVTPDTSNGLRTRAIRELKSVAKKDKESFVRNQAKKALAIIDNAGGTNVRGKIYVQIGPMSDKSREGGSEMRAQMVETAKVTLRSRAPEYVTNWPGGSTPNERALKKAGTKAAFFVDGSLVKLQVSGSGRSTRVSCKVSMYVATYPEKSMFGFVNGEAAVETSSSDRDIEEGKVDCVSAVMENLVATKLLPAMKVKVQ